MKKERKFRFIGDVKDYMWNINPIKGRIYTLESIDRMTGWTKTTYDMLNYWCDNNLGWQ